MELAERSADARLTEELNDLAVTEVEAEAGLLDTSVFIARSWS